MKIEPERIQSDIFIGKRKRLERYLVCALQGYFPVMCQTGPLSLAVIYRTGGTHISMAATLAVARSDDGGKSWSDPVEIAPRGQDVRNPALGVNSKGELIAAYWVAKDWYVYENGSYVWRPDQAQADFGASCYTTISKDGGISWGEPRQLSFKNLRSGCPYGRIISDSKGNLLMSVYGEPADGSSEKKENQVCLLRSYDDGYTWTDESIVARDFNETSFVLLPDGSLAAAARNWSKGAFVALTFSKDDGYTWSEPEQVTRPAEHPADLTLLQSGKLLLTFGRRIRPMGCGALLSTDLGQTWQTDKEVLLAGDGIANGDLGYPSTVQLADGKIVTVLYYASGSEAASGHSGWGDVSCQAIHYFEEDIS